MTISAAMLTAAINGTTKLKAGRHSDGRNLYLNVAKTGAMSWIFRYRDGQGERWLGLGSLTGAGKAARVTLSQARLRADAVRLQLAAGICPIGEKKAAKAAATPFSVVLEALLVTLRKDWKVKDGRCESEDQWRKSLDNHAATLLTTSVAKIDDAAVLKVLRPIWQTTPETAERVRDRIERVINLAKAKGWFTGENPARYDGHIETLLGKRPVRDAKARQAAAHKAADSDVVVAIFGQLMACTGNAARALAFLMLTAARTDEVRSMKWDEVDLDKAVWTVPAERMKAGVEHVVPLSSAAVAILRAQPVVAGNPYVFTSASKEGASIGLTAMADKLLTKPAKGGLGFAGKATVHGMRSAFRDWAGDNLTGYTDQVFEQCLAHQLDAVEGAYRRKTAVEKRREVMQAWANHLEGKSSVVQLKVAA